MEINEIELASELAHDATVKELSNIYEKDDLYQIDNGDALIYKDDVQDVFNRHYDYFLTKIEECNLKIQ